MKHVMIVLTLCMLVACGRSQQETSLAWKTDSLVRMSDSTLLIHMVYPVLTDTGAVADSINRTVMGVIRSSFDEQDSLRGDYTLDQSIDSMMAYKNNDEYLRKMPYTFVSEGTAFRYDNVVTVWIQRYIFTGGAHGMTPSEFFNFDYSNGRRLTNDQLFKDTAELCKLNRKAFNLYLEGKGITNPKQALFVSPDELPLPQNMGFDSIGLVMIYNQYEIAPYSFGLFVYSLPYDHVKSMFSDVVKGK